MPMFSTLALVALAGQEKVSFQHAAAPVAQVVAALAAQTGLPLEAGPLPIKETLFVYADGVAPDDLRRRIAQAASCRWTASGERFVLVPDDVRRRAEANASQAKFRARVARSLAALRKRLESKEPDDELGFGRAFGGMFGMGNSRLAEVCALAVGESGLGTVAPEGRVVWSTKPTAMQLPLSVPGLEAEVARAVEKHNEGVKQAGTPPPIGEAMPPEQAEMLAEMMNFMMGLGANKKIEQPPALVILVATRAEASWRPGGYLDVSARVYGADGTQLLESSTSLGSDWGAEVPMMESEETEPEAGAQPGDPVQDPEPPAPSWKLSDEALAFASILGGSVSAKGEDATSLKARSLLQGIGERDPLSYGPSEVLAAYAKSRGVNLVASIPDTVALQLGSCVNAEQVEALWGEDGALQAVEEGGWLAVSASDKDAARSGYFDRFDAAALIQDVMENGRVRLAALARYAQRNPDPEGWSLAAQLLRAGGVERADTFMASPDRWLALRLYGSLSDGQRAAASSGMRLPSGVWSPEQRRTAAQWVFGPEPMLRKSRVRDLVEDFTLGLSFFGMRPGAALELEPTFCAADWASSVRMLDIFERKESSYKPHGIDADGMPSSIGTVEMALLAMILEDPEIRKSYEDSDSGRLPERFVVGTRRVVEVVIEVAPGVFVSEELHEDDFRGAGEPVAFEALPEDELAKMRETAKSILASPVGKFFRMIGGMRIGRPEGPPP